MEKFERLIIRGNDNEVLKIDKLTGLGLRFCLSISFAFVFKKNLVKILCFQILSSFYLLLQKSRQRRFTRMIKLLSYFKTHKNMHRTWRLWYGYRKSFLLQNFLKRSSPHVHRVRESGFKFPVTSFFIFSPQNYSFFILFFF